MYGVYLGVGKRESNFFIFIFLTTFVVVGQSLGHGDLGLIFGFAKIMDWNNFGPGFVLYFGLIPLKFQLLVKMSKDQLCSLLKL